MLNFCCADVGNTVLVEFRVTDAAGNKNTCMVEVTVEDKLDPIITCPPNKTLECQGDYTDLGLTGEATAVDNCPGVIVTHTDVSIDINQCGVGTVTRLWTATDVGGRVATCYQTITLENSDPFGADDIDFPNNYDTDACGGDFEPEDLPAPFGMPQISEDFCDLVAITYEDEFFTNI